MSRCRWLRLQGFLRSKWVRSNPVCSAHEPPPERRWPRMPLIWSENDERYRTRRTAEYMEGTAGAPILTRGCANRYCTKTEEAPARTVDWRSIAVCRGFSRIGYLSGREYIWVLSKIQSTALYGGFR